jgi:hypothetical protein
MPSAAATMIGLRIQKASMAQTSLCSGGRVRAVKVPR